MKKYIFGSKNVDEVNLFKKMKNSPLAFLQKQEPYAAGTLSKKE